MTAQLNMTIVVFAWRRLAALHRLVRSLQGTEYCGTHIPLLFMLDANASVEVLSYARDMHWPHGQKRVYYHQGAALGTRGMWIEMFRIAAGRNMLPLEDDTEVSPLFFWWLLRVLRQYGPFTPAQLHARQLVGISLYTPRLNEIKYPQVKWAPADYTDSPAFLLQIPCSWGSLFFASHFEAFLEVSVFSARPPLSVTEGWPLANPCLGYLLDLLLSILILHITSNPTLWDGGRIM